MLSILDILSLLLFLPHFVLWKYYSFMLVLSEDILVFCGEKHISNKRLELSFFTLMRRFPEFRSLFLFRLARQKPYLSKILGFFTPRQQLCYIFCEEEFGGGCYIEHGFSTIVCCKKVGKNFRVNQQVTIGWGGRGSSERHSGCPIIGDNVSIYAGAKVIGNIRIGNNVVIGANCVVNKNVPDNCTVVGVPARIVRRNGNRVEECL